MRHNPLSLLLLLALLLSASCNATPGASTPTPTTEAGSSSTLSDQTGKPEPISLNFRGCPASGDGGDPILNTLKNRIDEAQWRPTTINDILALQWPKDIEQRPRSSWSLQDRASIARYEGIPVQVEGYLVDAKKMSPESCNCHAVNYVDFHVWIVDDSSKGRDQSIVIEVAPRVQSFHPQWTLNRIRELAQSKVKVRISGWLLMDPEHPDQIGKTRGTIWEIHPIMQIETQPAGNWQPLDNGATGISSAPSVAQTVPPVTPAETATQPLSSNGQIQSNTSVQITNVFYDGKKAITEPDEYVEIKNTGIESADMTEWDLQDLSGKNQFKWENFVLQPGETIRVYTNEIHPESGGFSFRSTHAIWTNSGNIAQLYDLDKQLVSRYAYGKNK